MKSSLAVAAAVGLGSSVVVIDQVTKVWASSQQLVTVNTGIAFGRQLPTWLGVIVGGILIISLGRLGIEAWKKHQQVELILLGVLIGGAVSNVVDRLRWGGVQDWLPIPGFQLVNNVADWAIVLASLGLLIQVFRQSRSAAPSVSERSKAHE